MAKPTAKKSTPRTPRPPRKKTAKKAVAAVAAPPAPPAAPATTAARPGYENPQERMARIDTASMLLAALNRVRPGTRSGTPNKCWSALTHEQRLAIAEAHCVRSLSEPKVRAEYAAFLTPARVASSTLGRFLRDVRTAFLKIYEEKLAETTEADQAAYATNDLIALQGIVYARLAPRFVAAGLGIGPESSAREMHPILRFMEGLSDAAKVQTDAKHKELQSVLLAIRAEAADGRKAKTPKERGESQKRITDMIDRYVRGGDAA